MPIKTLGSLGKIRVGRITGNTHIFSSPEPKAQRYSIPVDPASVCALVRPSVNISNSNISATSGPIITKFYLKHHWGGGLIALGFGPGRIGTLVSMATNSSHRVIMGKMLCPL